AWPPAPTRRRARGRASRAPRRQRRPGRARSQRRRPGSRRRCRRGCRRPARGRAPAATTSQRRTPRPRARAAPRSPALAGRQPCRTPEHRASSALPRRGTLTADPTAPTTATDPDHWSDPPMTTVPEPVLVRPFLAGEFVDGDGEPQVVTDKFDDRPLTTVQSSSRAQVERAVAAAQAAFERTRLPQSRRGQILDRAADLVLERGAGPDVAVAAGTGFVHADVAKEVVRTAETLRLCAEEARRLAGELVPLAGVLGQEHRLAFTRLDPLGVVCAI